MCCGGVRVKPSAAANGCRRNNSTTAPQHSSTPPRNHNKCITWIHGDKCPSVQCCRPGGDSVHNVVTDGCTVIQDPAPASRIRICVIVTTVVQSVGPGHRQSNTLPTLAQVSKSEEHLLSLYVVQEHNRASNEPSRRLAKFYNTEKAPSMACSY